MQVRACREARGAGSRDRVACGNGRPFCGENGVKVIIEAIYPGKMLDHEGPAGGNAPFGHHDESVA